MKRLQELLQRGTQLLDRLAGLCLAAVMVLVVINVLLRTLLKRPILGTYEYVGFLTAVVIGFSLAHCAIQDRHIDIDFILKKFPARVQAAVNVLIGVVSCGFLGLLAWQVGSYGRSLAVSGRVSSTTEFPYYPFIYMIAFGLFLLSLTVLSKTIDSARNVIQK